VRNRFYLILTLLFCITVVGLPSLYAGNHLLRMPSADFNLKHDLLVPLPTINKLALNKARELWGEVTPGEPIPCCDEEGKIVTYMCPFHIGKGVFPDQQKIMDGVKIGRLQVENVVIGLARQGTTQTENKTDAALSNETSAPLAGAGTPNSPINNQEENFQAALKKAKAKAMGIGEYGTVYVSARFDHYPIPLCSHYLSPFYFTGDLAQEKAATILGGDPQLAQYYFLGRRGQYFAFVNGTEKVLIQTHSLEVGSPINNVKQPIPSTKQLDDIAIEWQKITGGEVINKGGASQ